MLLGKESVLSAFKQSGKPQYKVYYNVVKAAGTPPCHESDASGDNGTNYARLEEWFGYSLMPGSYLIQFKDKLDDNTNIINILFKIPGEASSSPAISGVNNNMPAIGAYTPQVFNEIMDAKIGLLKEEHKREMLEKEREAERKELEDLRKQDNALPNFLNQWGPMLVQAIAVKFGGGAQGVPVQMAGFTNPAQAVQFNPEQNTQGPFVPQTENGTLTTEEKLTEVLQWLEQAEGSQEAGVELLYKMKKKAESNPALLGMLKTFLN